MLKKFLDYFIKITESKTTRIVLLFLFVFAGLFLSLQPAQAIFGFADFTITELASMQLDALDFVDNTIIEIIVLFNLMATESIIFIFSAANILQWAMAMPIKLGIGNPAENLLVNSGWSFVVGLVNMSFILIFVFMALSYILKIKIGKTEPKKILTNLIIVALLINFSLVFVGFIVDLADIFQRTLLKAFAGEQGNFVTLAFEPLRANSMNLLLLLAGIPVGYLITALIPYANVAALVTIGAFVLGEGMFGILSQTIVMIIFNFMIGGVLFFYAGLFIVRVVMIWILAIVSPLAFISYALGLKERWDEWLSLLTSWALLGVSALFFLGLGLKLFGAVVPPGSEFQIRDFTFPGLSFNYLFLLVYLVVSLDFVKKSVPKYAEMLIGQGKTLLKKTGGLALQAAQKRGPDWLVNEAERLKEMQERKGKGEKIPLMGKIDSIIGRSVASPARWAMRTFAQTTPEKEQESRRKAAQAKAETAHKSQLLETIKPWGIIDRDQKEAMVQLAKRGELGDAIQDKLTTEDRVLKIHETLSQEKEREKDAATILATTSEDVVEEAIRSRFPVGMGEVNKLRGEALLLKSSDANDRAEKEYQGLFNEVLKDLPDDQVKNINKDLLTSKNGIAWVLSSKGERLGEIVKSFDSKVVGSIQEAIDKKDIHIHAKDNPDLTLYLASTPARKLGLGLPETKKPATPKEIRRIVREARIETSKEAKIKPKIIITEREKEEKLHKITPDMPNYLRREVANASKYLSAIQQQRKTLDVLVEGIGKITQQISSLEQKASKTNEETELLKRLNSEIIQKQKEQIKPVSDSLQTLEERFKKSQKQIKDRLGEEKKERQEKGLYKKLEKKADKK